jgi:hypothetical protein
MTMLNIFEQNAVVHALFADDVEDWEFRGSARWGGKRFTTSCRRH